MGFTQRPQRGKGRKFYKYWLAQYGVSAAQYGNAEEAEELRTRREFMGVEGWDALGTGSGVESE